MTDLDNNRTTVGIRRRLSAEELGLETRQTAIKQHASNIPEDEGLDIGNALLEEVKSLIPGYGGVIFAGPPGTSKSWFAAKISYMLVDGATERRRFVQFHPSYQYEDFIKGFAPRADGTGFEPREGIFLELCRAAGEHPDDLYVLVIDELSRADPGRVFGEALTYIERTKRDLPFVLSSGETTIVPENLFVIATMNPADRGVDEVDAAFERRFARIPLDPDRNILMEMLEANTMPDDLLSRVVGFFDYANGRAQFNPAMALGHTYFVNAASRNDLEAIWRYQLRHHFTRALALNPDGMKEVTDHWSRTVGELQLADETSDSPSGDGSTSSP